jgi:hypothetical protein
VIFIKDAGNDAAQAEIPVIIPAILILIIGWFFLFPAICRNIPLNLPGSDLDFCRRIPYR